MCSACFRRSSLPADASLASTASSGASSPASAVLSKALRLPAAHPAALRCLRLAVPPRPLVLFAPRRTSAPPRPGVVDPVSPAGITRRKRQDLPGSWGTPCVRLPCSVDAGRTARTRPLRCSNAAPGIRTARAPTKGLSAFNSMAFGLAVYASRCGLPTPHARLASSRWSDSTGRDSHPQGSDERFQSVDYISSSSPKLTWRNRIDRSIDEPPCARRCRRNDTRKTAPRASLMKLLKVPSQGRAIEPRASQQMLMQFARLKSS
jgi:hypothetical protein